jgi:hypothetical protein
MSLNFEVESYKKNRIKELTTKYNNNKTTYNNSYRLSYNKILISNEKTLLKNIKINNLKIQYNETIKKMTVEYNNSISKINLFKVNPISIQNRAKRRALLVGINNYSGTNKLEGCKNDVLNIKNKLLTLGYNDNNIKTILDASANANNILDSLTNLLTTSVSGDLLIFHYSGHGSYEIDKNLDEFNTNCDQDIVGVDLKNISDDILKSTIVKNLKPNVTLIALFDCCYSGSVLDLRYQYMDTLNNNNYVENMNELETSGSVIMISGCTDIQTSADATINDMRQGAMTWSFLKSLNDASNNITWRQLIVNMRNSLKSKKFSQIPQISSGNIMELDAKVFI